MGALAQGPSVARGDDFVKTKLKTKKEVAKRKLDDQKSTAACSASGTPGPSALSGHPSPLSAPASSPANTTKAPLRILKLSPAQFAEVKRAKLERDTTSTAEMASVSEKSDPKVEERPKPSNPVMPQFLPPFPFSQLMPTSSYPMAPVTNAKVNPTNFEEQGTGTTMMWQAYSMSSFKK